MTDQELLDLLDRSWEKDDWDGVVHAMQAIRRRMKRPKEWVGLTDKEIDAAVKSCNTLDTYKYFRAIEAKLKEKNSG